MSGRATRGLPLLVVIGAFILSALAESGCSLGESFGADSRCDRRYGTSSNPEPFCQELLRTVAGKKFRDDCRANLRGLPDEGTCPREKIIAGCKSLERHDDDSVTIDWFYDVSGTDIPIPKERHIKGESDVRTLCSDRTRYADGAVFLRPDQFE